MPKVANRAAFASLSSYSYQTGAMMQIQPRDELEYINKKSAANTL